MQSKLITYENKFRSSDCASAQEWVTVTRASSYSRQNDYIFTEYDDVVISITALEQGSTGQY